MLPSDYEKILDDEKVSASMRSGEADEYIASKVSHGCFLRPDNAGSPKTENVTADMDSVYSPSHYNTGDIECIDAIKAALTPEQFIGFLRGNVLKYAWRAPFKGHEIEDVSKLIWYASRWEEAL